MALTHYLANRLLDHVLRNTAYTSPATVYVALFTVVPGVDGTGGTEVTGGSYARQALSSSAAAAGMATSSAALTFPSMPAATVRGAGLFDATPAGNLLTVTTFQTPVSVAAASDFVVPVADVVTVLR